MFERSVNDSSTHKWDPNYMRPSTTNDWKVHRAVDTYKKSFKLKENDQMFLDGSRIDFNYEIVGFIFLNCQVLMQQYDPQLIKDTKVSIIDHLNKNYADKSTQAALYGFSFCSLL